MNPRPFADCFSKNKQSLVLLGVSLTAFVWAFWTTLTEMAQRWSQDPMYSHGYLVPGFALLLLWFRRDHLKREILLPSWWGLPLLLAGLSLRFIGNYYYFVWFDAISLVPCLTGIWLMVGGRPGWRWGWPAVLFLLFMIPLPYRLAVALTGPLQKIATLCSTFALQTMGMPAVADGTVIRLNENVINIVEACSGLRMLVIFFALATAVALIIQRPLWQRILLIGSAAPIALLVNVLRITATGILFETSNSEMARAVFHDLAGWLMMPVALIFLGLELKILSRLIVDLSEPGPRLADPRFAGPHVARTRPGIRRKWQPAK